MTLLKKRHISSAMILGKKNLSKEERQRHINYVYDIVGLVIDIRKELPCALPEYIYQEAFAQAVREANLPIYKEYKHYPIFRGKPMKSHVRMDFMIPREGGNIIVEAKAIEKLTSHERSQLFSYMVATGFPYGLLVNFASYPHPTVERYLFDSSDMTLTAF